jgi:hypothetical protein
MYDLVPRATGKDGMYLSKFLSMKVHYLQFCEQRTVSLTGDIQNLQA